MKNKQRIGAVDVVGGAIFIAILFYFATNPLAFIKIGTNNPGKYIGWLFALFICNLVGVWFNIRHKNDPLTVTGWAFNWLVAISSFGVVILTLPLLHDVSPVLTYTILLAALLSVISLRITDESVAEIIIATISVVPLLARFGLGWFQPSVEQENYWKWIEIIFGSLAPLGIFALNHKSEQFLGTGPRAKWIWIHSFHTIFIALIILVMYRGKEVELLMQAKAKIGQLNGLEATAVAAIAVDAPDEKTENKEIAIDENNDTFLKQGGGIAIGTTVLWLITQPIDNFNFPIFLLILLCGIWTVFDREVSVKDRTIGAAICLWYGLMLGAVLLMTLFL